MNLKKIIIFNFLSEHKLVYIKIIVTLPYMYSKILVGNMTNVNEKQNGEILEVNRNKPH